ncbi:transketolase family protein [Kutzneria sp. CA-103260]|uniref:transketolase family protein n=1 Tax=Kutzneria sp. CA-103260 TaxID=2802641 RepID=UPI001BA4A68B|nr:transketolase C-terminal domain-containing protein [Kutzneria sp. CA-103260]QUQ64985.1 transketolase [Kutzneria sp. CA-103260]
MKRFSRLLLDTMETDSRVVVLDADLSRSSGSAAVADRWPDRFVNTGIAEQNTMGVAAGMALLGLRPIVHTFAAFATMRACEQIRTSIAYQQLNVTICASKGGLAASRSGPTHHATEDLAIMRAIPGMTVLAPRDFRDLTASFPEVLDLPGPVYIRMPPEQEPDDLTGSVPSIGAGVVLQKGADVVLAFTGSMTRTVRQSAERLSAKGLDVGIIYLPSVKPLDDGLIEQCARTARLVVTVEEHNVIGGLGSAVAEVLSARRSAPLLRLGVEDRFCYASGTHEEMLDAYCVSVEELVQQVMERC